MTQARDEAYRRIWTMILPGAAVIAVVMPLLLEIWAPRPFIVAWVGTYIVATIAFCLTRVRVHDPRLEFRWFVFVSVMFALVPASTVPYAPPEHAVFIAIALGMLHIANELSVRHNVTVGDWRIGPILVTVAMAAAALANVNWLVAAAIVGVNASIINHAKNQRLVEGTIRYERDHDDLTGLLNRRGFLDAMQAHADEQATVLSIDADNFKMINDTYGHAAGDAMLVAIADALIDRLGPGWMVARQGGDEFAALASGRLPVPVGVARVVTCKVPWRDDDLEIEVQLSAGVAYSDAADVDKLMSRAGYALKASKRSNAGGLCVFDPELERRFTRALDVTATANATGDALFAVAQPIAGATEICGWEILARWRGSDGAVLSPAAVLPLLAENGLMPQFNDRMLELGVRFAARFNGVPDAPFVSVNITASHLANPSLVHHVRTLIEKYGIEASRLMIEITEGEELDGLATWQITARDLVGLGVQLAIDDFGSGYSNIDRIHQLPITHLKFDRAFAISGDGPLGEVVRGVVRFAKASGLGIIAEGIETAGERDAMRNAGIEMLQGYLFGKPATLDIVEHEWVSMRRGRQTRARREAHRQPEPQTPAQTSPVIAL